jgi:hypothetical protein
MKNLAYWLAILIFILDKIIQNFFHAPIWLSSYLDDFLLLPIFLGSALLVQQKFINQKFTFKITLVIVVWLIFSVLFEFLFPSLISGYTSDYWDILVYGLGGVYYLAFINYPAVNSKQ